MEEDKRIDFLCVQESNSLIVVEIKRAKSKASLKELLQIERYVSFMRDYVIRTTDPSFRLKHVVGYLLCGTVVDTWEVNGKLSNLQSAEIYVRKYTDLLGLVERSHKDFLSRYGKLREAKKLRNATSSQSAT